MPVASSTEPPTSQGPAIGDRQDGVVRKDWKVLAVNISAPLGTATSTTNDVALSVAAAIMGCWSGDGSSSEGHASTPR
ncbi:MAG: hypothetical protein ACLQRH_09135 [Acidimicrobiales bacterium]